MKNILDAKQFNQQELNDLFSLTDHIKNHLSDYQNKLKGKVIATLFFEPSTRTRLSFETAIARLGASFINITSPGESSTAKGESYEDTIKIVSSYSDLLVIRHPDNDAAVKAAIVSETPIINAGSGSGEHPTQTLLDLYTIKEAFGHLDNLSVAVIGDLKYGRAVHSLVNLLSIYNNITVYGLSNEDFLLPKETIAYLKERQVNYVACDSFDDIPKDVDVLYQTRKQKERFSNENLKEYSFNLDKELLSTFSEKTIVLHPLPRNEEINPDVDEDARALYFRQAKNGLYVRMALILTVLRENGML